MAAGSCAAEFCELGEGVKLTASGCRVLSIPVGLLVLSSLLAAPVSTRCVTAVSSLWSPVVQERAGLRRSVVTAVWTGLLLSMLSPFRATVVAAVDDLLPRLTTAAVTGFLWEKPAARGMSARLLYACSTGAVRRGGDDSVV